MAAPSIRGVTAPTNTVSPSSPSSTQVGDRVVVWTWTLAGAGVPTHTLQSGFTEILSHSHDDGSTDGRLSCAYKDATSAGANTYQAYAESGSGITGRLSGILVLQSGTFDTATPAGALIASATQTTNAIPNPPALSGMPSADYLVAAVAAWHTASATVTVTPPTNYTEQWEAAGANVGELSLATRALTGITAEDPGTFGDDVTPNGTAIMTIAFGPGGTLHSRTPSDVLTLADAQAVAIGRTRALADVETLADAQVWGFKHERAIADGGGAGGPTPDLENDPTGVADGTTVTTGNSGGSSGDAFDVVNTGRPVTYETVDSEKVIRFDASGGTGQAFVEWDLATRLGHVATEVFARIERNVDAGPSANHVVYRLRAPTTLNHLLRFRLNGTSDKFEIFDATNTLRWTSTMTEPIGNKYRVEIYWSRTVARVKVWADPTSSGTPDEDSGDLSFDFGSVLGEDAAWLSAGGNCFTTTQYGIDHVADLAISETDWLGPQGAGGGGMLADAVAAVRTLGRQPADVETLADATTQVNGRGRAIADVETLADVAARVSSHRRAPTDLEALADAAAFVKILGRQPADVEGLSDATSRVLVYRRTPNDLEALSDVAAKVSIHRRSPADVEVLADTPTWSRVLLRSAADVETLADAIARLSVHRRSPADLEELADSVSYSKSGAAVRNVSDVLTLSDTISRILAYVRSPADVETLSDVVSRAVFRPRSVADVLALADLETHTRALRRSPADLEALSDAIAIAATGLTTRSLSDALGLSDAVLARILDTTRSGQGFRIGAGSGATMRSGQRFRVGGGR